MTKFKLWLEFEEADLKSWDKDNDFANIHVDLTDGRHYGINVWTFNFLETSVTQAKKNKNNLDGLYITPPDLFVKELSRECIQATITDILKKGDLETILNPSVLSSK